MGADPREGQGRLQGRRHILGALPPRLQRWDPTNLLDGGSEGPQDGCGTPTVPLHPWHGGLGMEQSGERGVSGC